MNEFLDHVIEVLGTSGDVRSRRMFGGVGLFRDGLMFALIADDTLFLKADSHSRHAFESLGLEPFQYEKRSGKVKLSYFTAPEEIFEDDEQARLWAHRAFDAALRTGAKNN